MNYRRWKKILRPGFTLALAACLLPGCGLLSANAEEPAPERIRPTIGYAYDSEEILYLAGVKAAAENPALSYSLYDMDGDGISELFLRREDAGDVTVYRFEEATRSAGRIGSLDEAANLLGSGIDPASLTWAGGPWADGSIIGVARQTGDPGVRNDFYLAANYAWLSEEHITAAGEVSSGTDELEESVKANKLAMFTDTETYRSEDIRRLRDYYALAVNWERSEADGVEPAKKYLEAAEAIASLSDLTAYLTDPETDPFCTLMSFTVTLDTADTSHWAVSVAEDSFSVLPRVFHNYDAEDVAATREDFSRKARHVLERAGYAPANAEKILNDC